LCGLNLYLLIIFYYFIYVFSFFLDKKERKNQVKTIVLRYMPPRATRFDCPRFFALYNMQLFAILFIIFYYLNRTTR